MILKKLCRVKNVYYSELSEGGGGIKGVPVIGYYIGIFDKIILVGKAMR
jgi:hypothetical protein